jgi:hypothetical protein
MRRSNCELETINGFEHTYLVTFEVEDFVMEEAHEQQQVNITFARIS